MHSVLSRGPILNLHTPQTKERLTKLSLITIEKNILQDLKNSLNFCDSAIDIFNEKVFHVTEVEGVIRSHAPPLSIAPMQFAIPDPDYTPILLLKACLLPLSPI